MLFLCTSTLNAKCYYLPCNAQVQQAKSQTKASLSNEFEQVKLDLKNLKLAYEEKLEALKEVNHHLSTQLALKKNALLKEKEIVFYFKQFNALQANQNSLSATRTNND